MPKRNMRDLIKKETSSQTSKPTKSSRTQKTEEQTNKFAEFVSNEEPNLQSTDHQDSDSNEETKLQLNQPSDSITHKETDKQTFKNTDSVTNRDTGLQSTEQEKSDRDEATKQQTNKLTESETTKQPKYLTLLRKEARLREDQFDDLTTLARTLNRRRKGGERITENTLIRLAVDLLLKETEQLDGSTEEELREALDL